MHAEAKRLLENLFEGFRSSRVRDDDVSAILQGAKDEIRAIRANIDNVNDDMLLDMYIYRLRAAEAQYKHLLQMAKEGTQRKTG